MARRTATTASELAEIIEKLKKEKAEHEKKIAEIDSIFEKYGIDAESATRKKPGPKPGATRKKRGPKKKTTTKKATTKKKTTKKKTTKKKAGAKRGRKRQTFSKSGEESVLDFVREAGSPNSAEVNAHWEAEGRKGRADNALSKLVSDGKLKRVNAPGERGSRYKVA